MRPLAVPMSALLDTLMIYLFGIPIELNARPA
jgi:hypothetical protein